ncbi:Aspartyl-tRNA(Asn) amidotransferase subunit C [Lachnospiraceae bacterium TWA4]|nr:Aspartyl-tRNA(Asn) amidotransferase subunit C [Lachnospiraceae bacterium TWA4]
MKKISDEMIETIGILSKLELSDEEKKQAKLDMEKMLVYIDKLNELDTNSIEPMSHVFPVTNVFREDIVTSEDIHEKVLENAPAKSGDLFLVPKTFE